MAQDTVVLAAYLAMKSQAPASVWGCFIKAGLLLHLANQAAVSDLGQVNQSQGKWHLIRGDGTRKTCSFWIAFCMPVSAD